jgi:hypothetical protein
MNVRSFVRRHKRRDRRDNGDRDHRSCCEADWFIRIAKPKDEHESPLLREVLAGQAIGVHSHEALVEYRVRLIAGELASVKASEAALRAEVAPLRLELTKVGQTQAEIEELRTAIELERSLRQEAESSCVCCSSGYK